MKMFNKKTRRVLGLLVLGILASASSCNDEDSSTDSSEIRYVLERDLRSYTAIDTFEWNTTVSRALVNYTIRDYRNGSTTLRIFDADRDVIFRRVFVDDPGTFTVGNNEFAANAATDSGTPGVWTIELRYENLTGETRLILE